MADSACVTINIRTRDLEAYLSELDANGRNRPTETDSDIKDRPGVTNLCWHSTVRLDATDWHFANIPFYGGNDDGGGMVIDTDYACDGIECEELATLTGDWAVRIPRGHDPDEPVPIDGETKKFMRLYREAQKLVDAG